VKPFTSISGGAVQHEYGGQRGSIPDAARLVRAFRLPAAAVGARHWSKGSARHLGALR